MTSACWAVLTPGVGHAQAALHIDNNTTVTAPAGTSTYTDLVAGFNSGSAGALPGGTFVAPSGATVMVSNLFSGFAAGSSGLVTVNGGTISTSNPQSQYYIGFNGSGTLAVSNGGTVFSAFNSFVGYNGGSSGVLTVDGQGSTYTNAGFFVVGNGGPAQLKVTNGGVVSTTQNGQLQIGGGSPATAQVSGPGSRVSAAGFLGVGVVSSGSVLTITDGAMATSGLATYIAFNAGSGGTIVLSNGGTLAAPTLIVGSNGAGNVQVQAGGTATISGPTIVATTAGASSVAVGGAGAKLTVQNGDLVIGGQGNGAMTISGQGTVSVTSGGGTYIAGECASVPSFCTASLHGGAGAVTVTDPGTALNAGAVLTVGQFGAGKLTITNGAKVSADSVVIAQNAGSSGVLNIGAAAGAAPASPGVLDPPAVTFGAGAGAVVFNHTDTSGTYTFAPPITGTGAVDVYNGATVMTGASDYFGPTTLHAGALSAGAANVFSAHSDYVVQAGATLDLHGFSQAVGSLSNAGLVNLGAGTPPHTLLTVNGDYIGRGGVISLNTYLGADDSPSDVLVVNGGHASGTTFLRVINAGGPGVATTSHGIPVVEAINGATTAPGAFALLGETRSGAYDHRLYRSGHPDLPPDGTLAHDWFLRSTFVVAPPPVTPEPEQPGTTPPVTPPPVTPPPVTPPPVTPPGGREEPELEEPEQPIGPTEPPEVLPEGIWPIIGPELATYGVVQPIARQMGLAALGTLHERVGDTTTDPACPGPGSTGASPAPDSGCLPVWGRLFGQQINNRYQAFADPHATGQVIGVQAGVDVWRGSLAPGHSDAAGLYFAYGSGDVRVDGLVTNAAATGYELRRTGSLDLNAYSLGGYWTHYGPGDWYVDAVLQGSVYDGKATTVFARLPASGSGFVASLEGGYPVPLPALGPRFVLEPEAQIIWQQVSFRKADDGLGPVALGTTSGATGRLGLRGRWTISDQAGRVWQPYALANVWRDWGADATTQFAADPVPLKEQTTRLEFAGGLTAKVLSRLSVYAQAGYQFALGAEGGGRRDGVKGTAGLRFQW